MNAQKRIEEMCGLMEIMLAALQKQPYHSNYIKQGLSRLQASVENFEAAKQDECEARRKLTSFVALPAARSSKREAFSFPLAPTGALKTTKKEEERKAIMSAFKEWTIVQKKQKTAEKKPSEQKAQEEKGEERAKTPPTPKKRRLWTEAIALKPAEGNARYRSHLDASPTEPTGKHCQLLPHPKREHRRLPG